MLSIMHCEDMAVSYVCSKIKRNFRSSCSEVATQLSPPFKISVHGQRLQSQLSRAGLRFGTCLFNYSEVLLLAMATSQQRLLTCYKELDNSSSACSGALKSCRHARRLQSALCVHAISCSACRPRQSMLRCSHDNIVHEITHSSAESRARKESHSIRIQC